ncbi:hypothetical protein QBC47DRAFT_389385 [Echria macrotheca]|uniref:Secreted protein n=1 Tax=Echria macrotheca TaxID=438768 RepID=A0AAJ0F255_9PEZI|nr:hypothetical protein QBC47DRAFT_389385 [Echria macrotheca]
MTKMAVLIVLHVVWCSEIEYRDKSGWIAVWSVPCHQLTTGVRKNGSQVFGARCSVDRGRRATRRYVPAVWSPERFWRGVYTLPCVGTVMAEGMGGLRVGRWKEVLFPARGVAAGRSSFRGLTTRDGWQANDRWLDAVKC